MFRSRASLAVRALPIRQFSGFSLIGALKKLISPVVNKPMVLRDGQDAIIAIKYAANNAAWHSRGMIGTDFRSKHSILLIHLWMIHRRVLEIGDDAREFHECVFDLFWDDTKERIRELGVHEIVVNKTLKDVQGYSFRAMVELDVACDLPTETQVLDEYCAALWRAVYLRREIGLTSKHVRVLARYIRHNQKVLRNMPLEKFLNGQILFDPMPAWTSEEINFVDGEEAEVDNGSHDVVVGKTSDPLSPGKHWVEMKTSDGKSYYKHEITGIVQWSRPLELTKVK